MSRIEQLQQGVSALYQAKHEGRAEWADWLYAHHLFLVEDQAGKIADRFGAKKELAMAAGLLHDIADAVMGRNEPRHEEESFRIARSLLHDAGFSEEEMTVIVDDAMKWHGCHNGNVPTSLEGKVMATADALAHLQSDFYEHAVQAMRASGKTIEQIKQWALPKIERDFQAKIFFPEIQEDVRSDYERLKSFFSEELR